MLTITRSQGQGLRILLKDQNQGLSTLPPFKKQTRNHFKRHFKTGVSGSAPDSAGELKTLPNPIYTSNIFFYFKLLTECCKRFGNVGPLLAVFGEFNTIYVVGHHEDPQKGTSVRDFACFEPLCVKIYNSKKLNSTPPEGGLNKGKEARKLKNIPDSLNDSQVFF